MIPDSASFSSILNNPQILMEIFFIFLFSGVFGSFFNMLIYRLPRDLSLVLDRSKCPSCKNNLTWIDLFPVFSFLFLLGKCRQCKSKIPFRYFLVELITILSSLILWFIFGPTWLFLKFLLFSYGMIIIFFTDIETYIVPDSVLVFFLVIGSVNLYIERDFKAALFGALVGFGTFYLVQLIGKFFYKKDAFGSGDVKLGGAIGFVWGPVLTSMTVYLSFLIGGLFSILLIVSKKKTMKDIIPFGPSIIIAFFLSYIFKTEILSYFFS